MHGGADWLGWEEGRISIEGPGPDLLTIDANGAESIFQTVNDIDISGMRLTGSTGRAIRATKTSNADWGSSLRLDNVWIDGNAGGAISIPEGVLELRNSVVAGNGFVGEEVTAEKGGAINVSSSTRGLTSALIEGLRHPR